VENRRPLPARLVIALLGLVAGVVGVLPGFAAAETACQGFGSSTPGGSNGAVYHVTTLDDSGPGSLRDAVSEGDRLVVFDVAGDIVLTDHIYVRGAFVTIDATTAPAPGITLRRAGLIIRGSRGAHDVVVRGLRVRDSSLDGIQVAYGAQNVVLDHVSVSNSTDGLVDISDGASDVTVCWSLLADSTSHGMAIKYGATRITLHDNVFVGNITSSPNAFVDNLGTPATDTTLDMRNNLVWHWGNGWGTAVHHGALANVVDNLYYSKNSPPGDQANALIVCKGDCNGDPLSLARAYTEGNVSGDSLPTSLDAEGNEPAPFPAPTLTTRAACPAAYDVLADAGARPLDAIDQDYLATVTMPSVCIVDLIVASVGAPPSATAGTTVDVPVGVKNRGPGAVVEPTTVRVFLATGAVPDGTEVEVGSATVPPIDAAATATVSVSVRIPSSAGTAGTYYLLAVADADDTTVEALEDNNLGSSQIRVGPDMVIASVIGPASAAPGSTISVSDTTRNRGLGPAAATVTKFYLSTLSTLDETAVYVGERAVPPLAAGETNTASTSLVVPMSVGQAGIYYLVAVADGGGSISELDETNNTRAAKILIGPDLVIDALTAPASAVAGTSIAVTDTVRNRGTGPVPATTTSYYLSTVMTLDATAIAIGSRTVPALAAGETNTATTPVAIPSTVGAAGTYYVLGVVDGPATITEMNEANNVRAARVLIGPDLVVDAVTPPDTAVAGTTVAVTDTVRNRGAGPAAPSSVVYYLSTSAIFDATAVRIGSRPVPGLANSETNTGTGTVTIPASAGAAGTYYVIAMADGDSGLVEMDETNNARAARIRVGPDLVVDALAAPVSAAPGASVGVTDTVRNRGVGPSGTSTTVYYFSTSPTFDGTAVRIGSRAVPALAPAETTTGTATVTIPATAGAAGTYYILAYADGEAGLAETDETNNVRAVRIMVGPDLVVDSLTAPIRVAAGTSVDVTDTVRNRGVGPSTPTAVVYYLSTGLTLDGSAVRIGTRPVPALDPAGTNTGTGTVTLPSGVGAAGFYYILAVADGESALAEPDETNNVTAFRVAVGADMVVDVLTGPASAIAGSVITVSDTTRDRGVGPVGATQTRFYLSTTPGLEPGAINLGSRTVPSLAAGENSTAETSLTLPWWVGEAGTYYLVAVADGDGASSETDETNNVRAARLIIGPDLVIDSVIVPASIPAGSSVDVTDQVRNRGMGPAGAATLRYYLSTRKTADDFLAIPLASRAVSPLAAGTTESATTTITIPADTPSGTRYLIVVVDADRAVPEMNEDNNSRYWPITIP
jgi:subtilase family serine protease